MKKPSFYINEIKIKQGIESDYAVAKRLDLSRQSMTKYKQNKLTFDSHIIFKVAELSGHNPLEILLNMKASKEKDPSFLKKWEDLIKMVPDTAAAFLLPVILSFYLVTALPSNVDITTVSALQEAHTLVIM